MPEQSEICTLEVGGQEFQDWETVWVQTNYTDSYSQFRFTCAEREGFSQIEPGSECVIRLGDKQAISGVILTRQIAYDANSHGVMLQGVSLTWYAGRASIYHKTGRFDNMSFKEIADKVLDPTGIKYQIVGNVPDTKFRVVQAWPGEKIFDFLERLGREVKVIIAADKKGNYVFVGSDHSPPNVGSIIEGQNILSCQAVISEVAKHSEYTTRASCPAHDDKKYRFAAQQEARAEGSARRYSPLVTPIEHPVYTDKEVETRCNMEQMWHEGQDIQVTVTVQGWFTQGGELWEAGTEVNFKSPMAMINDVLKIQVVTFTQDVKSGSLTTLLLVAPWGLNGKRGFSRGPGGNLKPAKIDKSAPKDPPGFLKKG
jgi:prophage tail gpP-like protein